MGIKFDEKSCGVVLYREEEGKKIFLILHYPSGHWDLPKGHIEEGETEHETAARELLEETGIADLEFVDGYREEISYQHYPKGKLSNKQVIFFLGKTELSDVRLSHEHHDFEWLDYEKAVNKLTFDNAKNLVIKAKEFLET